MRNNIVCATAFFVAISSMSALAAVIHVPADQPTIQAGIDAAATNDTVMVSSGIYDGGLSCNKAISLFSELGPDVTSLVHSGVTLHLSSIHPDTFYISGFGLISTADRAIASDFSNFHVDNCNFPQAKYATIHFSGYSGTIRNSRFSDNTPDPFAWNAAVFVDNLGKTRLERNVFYGLKYPYVFFTTAERVECINNSIVNCDGGFNVANGYGSPGQVYNNIFWGTAGNAIVTNGLGPQIDYNLYYANGADVSGGAAGVNSVFADPLLADTAFWDFTPIPGSPVVDAGHPDPEYNDVDNSRNDIGAIPGEKSYPRIVSLGLMGEDRFHVVNHAPLIVWEFLDTIAEQSAFEIEVGTDQDWSIAEQWATAPVPVADTTVTYSGALLMDGLVYYLRARVSNGIEWSQWRTISFRMNSVPSVPTLSRPIAGAESVSMATTLVIVNSTDAQFDTLSYAFEVFADPGMTVLVDSISGVQQGTDSTSRELSETLPPDADYWWRSRAFDGREYSAWSSLEMFHARGSRAFVVPGDYASIPEAVISASAYDTILVYPGTYSMNLDLSIKQARLISTAGPTETILIHESTNSPIITTGSSGISRTEIVGFTFIAPSGAAAIKVMSGTPAIRGNIFRDSPTPYGIPPVAVNGGNPLISRNFFKDNQAMAAVGVYGGSARIINNTFVNNQRGFFTLTAQGEAINNIVMNSVEYGIYGDFSRSDYNNVWMNNPDYASGTAGTHDISSDPEFIEPAAGDFGLLPNSPCFNAGDPDPIYNDPDGTRADIGAYPFSGPLPIGLSLFIHAENRFHVIGDNPRFRWTFYDTLGTMSGYEAEVGTDDDWTVAELWSSGLVYTTLPAAQYSGAMLQDGELYWLRIRLYNGADWGAWTFFTFRMNSVPTVPQTVDPIAFDTLHFQTVRSVVDNSIDSEGDSLSYEFELYVDSLLGLPSATLIVPQADSQTQTPLWNDLLMMQSYWWRVRAYDGWEYSDWSPALMFFARGPGIIRVPQRRPSISEAVEAAGPEDTVLVSAGTYSENINLNGKSIHLLSTNGAGSTVLSPHIQPLHTILLGTIPAAQCEIGGFTFIGGQAGSVIALNGGAAKLHDNIFKNFNGQPSLAVVIYVTGGAHEIYRNVFYQNDGTACIGIYGGNASIINNTFDRNEGGILQILGSGIVRNNIVTGSETFGIYGSELDANFNCVFENYPNYQQFGGGPNDIIASPVYYDGLGGDFRLQSGSPCINSGDPDPMYNDVDGSRNDMGAVAAVCDCGCHSDPLCDHTTDILDVIFVIGNAFRGLEELKDDFCFSHADGSVGGRTDVNCSGYTDIVDVVRIIDVVFRGVDPASIFCASCNVP